MPRYIIQGGKKLKGNITVSGAKNMALKVIPATLLSDEPTVVKRVPEIEDVKRLLEILRELGVKIERIKPGTYRFTPDKLDIKNLDYDLITKYRASLLLLGPLLARFGNVKFPHPGGCTIGKRPIDLFIKGFKQLGAKINETEDYYEFSAKNLQGDDIVFTKISVTGTETMMLAAVTATGKTKIINAAQEPEVTALANYLNSVGADIQGAGTSIITINGVEKIHGGMVEVIPDRLETGTYLAMALATHSSFTISDCNPELIRVPIQVAKYMGADIDVSDNAIHIKKTDDLRAVDLKTHEYPGFITDLQAPFTVALTQTAGQAMVHETIFEGRLFYTDFLNRMGANVLMCDPHRVLITGPTTLRGKTLESPDLRAGIAMVIAGLAAEGETIIENIYQIERGYENLVEKLHGIGAKISRVNQ